MVAHSDLNIYSVVILPGHQLVDDPLLVQYFSGSSSENDILPQRLKKNPLLYFETYFKYIFIVNRRHFFGI